MPLLETITSAGIKYFVGKALDRTAGLLKELYSKEEYEDIKKLIPELLSSHLIEISNWSRNVNQYGLNSPKKTDRTTIELLLNTRIKKFSGPKQVHEFYSESDISDSPEHFIILGYPGAGKTTLLKRIALKQLDVNNKSKFGFPIMVLLRELEQESLSEFICKQIGLKFSETSKELKGQFHRYTDDEGREIVIQKTVKELKIGDKLIEIGLSDFLNAARAIILLDGLDELRPSIKTKIIKELGVLSRKMSSSKIILSSRTGEYHKTISGFCLTQIEPLTIEQIKDVSNKWLGDKHMSFMQELETKPYKDLINRPLFVCFLLILFDRLDSIPHQAIEIYEQIIFLVLRDWDQDRDIIRRSNYADFEIPKKLRFLSEVSYHLTYEAKTNVFSTDTLKDTFKKIHHKYGLKESEMEDVVSEIESHNGLLAFSHSGYYEFTHLSLQEYLCACYIVKQPFSELLYGYFVHYPEPLAIAVALSSNPSQWFAVLILNNQKRDQTFAKLESSSVHVFLGRLFTEQPLFEQSNELGYAVLYLLFEFGNDKKLTPSFLQLIDYPEITESVKSVFHKYDINENVFNRKFIAATNYYLDIPKGGTIPKEIWTELKKASNKH